jgi:putative secretion ATPase (PEP-CTERM system associated)
MYEQFYGFTEKPFTLLPDPSFLYLGKKHSTAFSLLEYGLLSQAGFTVITGEVGSGKTTLIRHLLNQIEDDVQVGLVNSSHHGMGELLRWVMLAFGLEYEDKDKVSLHDKFTRFLIDQYAQNKRVVLIIDEAQNLEPHVLEELRLLSNINADKDQVLQIILVGQPELRKLLKNPSLLQFLQRVSVDYHLTGLSEEETLAYINHRIRCAGREEPIFTESACSLIFNASKGIPRVINTLCDTALVYGFSDNKTSIDDEIINSVLADKAESGLFQAASPEEEEQSVQVSNYGNESKKKTKAASVTQFDTDMAKLLFTSLSSNKKK